jgi:hypothetical protein
MATKLSIADFVAKLQQRLVAIGDGRDAKSENERINHRRAYDATQGCISGLRNVPVDLETAAARMNEWEARRVAFLAKQTEIEQAIETAPDWKSIDDARMRDAEIERQRQLRLQLQLLRAGTLLVAPGVTYGSLSTIDARIAELQKRRDGLQSALDAHLKTAEQLLAATVAR